MSFNLNINNKIEEISIDTLTFEMINDLIICYANDIAIEDIEIRYLLKERTDINPQYPIIRKEVISQFYEQLELVKTGIFNIIKGNYHIGDDFHQGTTPLTIQELKDILFIIIVRDFYEENSWIYNFTKNDFNILRPFSDKIVDLVILYSTNNDYDKLIKIIKEN